MPSLNRLAARGVHSCIRRRGWRWGRWTPIAAAVAILIAAGSLLPVHADHPSLLLPAPAGTEWLIVGGYNTATHTGGDPHALDIVRTDAPTEGTAVLAPVGGRITYVSSDCITIRDSHGLAVLLCHLFAADGLTNGDTVRRGEIVGQVAPSGAAGNNGLPHIHLALHTSFGGGQVQTIPFTAPYSLEERDLPPTTESNAYAGETFISTNHPEAAEPDYLYPGWNLIGWTGNTTIEQATAPIAGAFSSVFAFAAESQTFRRYTPDARSALNDLDSVRYGDGLLIFVTAPGGAVWQRPPATDPYEAALAPGFNIVAWTAGPRAVSEAVAGLGEALIAVYGYDAFAQRYRVYRPEGPAFLNDLTTLEPGQAVWLQTREAAIWRQG